MSSISVELSNSMKRSIRGTATDLEDQLEERTNEIIGDFTDSGLSINLEKVDVVKYNELNSLDKEGEKPPAAYYSNPEEDRIQIGFSYFYNSPEKCNMFWPIFTHEIGHAIYSSVVGLDKHILHEDWNPDINPLKWSEPVRETLSETFAEFTRIGYEDFNREDEDNPSKNLFEAAQDDFEEINSQLKTVNKPEEVNEDITKQVQEGNFGELQEYVSNLQDNLAVIGGYEELNELSDMLSRNLHETENIGHILNVFEFKGYSFEGLEYFEQEYSEVESESELRFTSNDILTEYIEDKANTVIEKLYDSSQEDDADLVLEQWKDDTEYLSRLDIGHLVSIPLANIFHEEDCTTKDLLQNTEQFLEISEDAIRETIKYGIESVNKEGGMKNVSYEDFKDDLYQAVEDKLSEV